MAEDTADLGDKVQLIIGSGRRRLGWVCSECGERNMREHKNATVCPKCGAPNRAVQPLQGSAGLERTANTARELFLFVMEKLGPVEVLQHTRALLSELALNSGHPVHSRPLYKALEALENAPLLETPLPHRLDAVGGPECRCGRASRHESGWCGECE